jgi:hypothetical protein
MTQRFTIDGSNALEERLSGICEGFAEGIRGIIPENVLEGIVLGGGYGRGEGGVRRDEAGVEHPYNDLEFYVFVRPPLLFRERVYRKRIHALAHEWSEKAGIEVESKLLTLQKLRDSEVTMFFHDLVIGHRQLHGAAELFGDCEQHRGAHRIPLHEGLRLLMNRSSGLLFATELMQRPKFSEADADFVRRNISKAQLALGDVLLVAQNLYHSSCRERHRRLQKFESMPSLAGLSRIIALHECGVDFKLHPRASRESRDELKADLQEAVTLTGELFLWVERRRLKQAFADHRDYAFSEINKQPEQRLLKNFAINLRTFKFGALSRPTCYPRERLLESLALMLWSPDALSRAETMPKLQRDLGTRAKDFSGLVAAYRGLWSKFN